MATKKTQNNIEKNSTNKNGKMLFGSVVSTKMKDTIVVKVTRFIKHPKYGKFYKVSKNFKAHDKGNTVSQGDKVEIIETKPISKDKHFILSKVITKKVSENIEA